MDQFESKIKFALVAISEPSDKVNEAIIRNARRTQNMSKFKIRKLPAVAMLAFALLSVTGGTAFATWQYLHPKDVAVKVGNQKLADAFAGEKGKELNVSKTRNGIKTTILGIASGKEISDFVTAKDSGEVVDDCTYVVTAFSKEDGTKFTEKDMEKCSQYYVSPYIKGQDPVLVNVAKLDGGYVAFVEDGIYYRLIDCSNLEIFAKQGIYLGVCDRQFDEKNAFAFDENTGEITENKSYQGMNMLFSIPLDESKADDAAVEKKIKEWKSTDQGVDSQVENSQESSKNSVDHIKEAWCEKNIKEKAKLQTNTIKTMVPDKDGNVNYDWEVENMSVNESIVLPLDEYKVGELNYFGYSSLDDGRQVIETCTKNADGTVTLAIYLENK